MFAHVDDTIVAISSAAGGSPRGVLRLSGRRAIDIAAAMFTPAIDRGRGFRRYCGAIRWSSEELALPAELYVFRSPRSFTRQDMAEVHTVGSPPVLAGLFDEMLRCGARPAEPGEFTGRAFLAGAMDLTAVEGVAAMIHAGSDAQLRAAERLLHGTLSRETQRLQSRLADLLSLVEASIDFVEEVINFISPERAEQELASIVADVEGILHRGAPMERLDARYRVSLLGPPNAGKSTLFNRLTGLDRAICSSSPGTTRDVIMAPVPLPGGAEIWLMDSAGVGNPGGAIENEASVLARQAAGGADVILLVVDGREPIAQQIPAWSGRPSSSHAVIVINKTDVLSAEQVACAKKNAAALGRPVCAVSAATGRGCSSLMDRLSDLLHAEPTETATTFISLNARHRLSLTNASSACGRALFLVRGHARIAEVAEFTALELREALAELGAIVGEITTDEVLGRIFSRFCVGK